MKENVVMIKTNDLKPFPNNPFGIRDDEAMKMLAQSVMQNGVMTPLIVRKLNDGYEVLSGCRRLVAAKISALSELPVLVRDYDDNQAVILLVDSNLQRPELLPSEKAVAFKMKLEALKHQGKTTSVQAEQKLSRDLVGELTGESGTQVYRYIRLTNLEKPILDLVDEGKIALTPAVELSFLSAHQQRDLLSAMEYEDATPSYSQSVRLRKMSVEGILDAQTIFAVMSEKKANQKEKISLKTEELQKYFPRGYSVKDMENTIIKLLTEWQIERNRNRDRDDR